MLTQSLMAATDMYKENSRVISLMEDKAQKAAGLAAALLGAAFAFLRRDSLQDLWSLSGWSGLLLLAAVLVIMLFCVLASTQVLGARTMKTPPDPSVIFRHVEIYLQKYPAGPPESSRENNLRDQIVKWNEAIANQHESIRHKSSYLLVTQRLLVAGVAAVFASLWVTLFAYGISPKMPAQPPKTTTPFVQQENPHDKMP